MARTRKFNMRLHKELDETIMGYMYRFLVLNTKLQLYKQYLNLIDAPLMETKQ